MLEGVSLQLIITGRRQGTAVLSGRRFTSYRTLRLTLLAYLTTYCPSSRARTCSSRQST